jgi:hypothetical protein
MSYMPYHLTQTKQLAINCHNATVLATQRTQLRPCGTLQFSQSVSPIKEPICLASTCQPEINPGLEQLAFTESQKLESTTWDEKPINAKNIYRSSR